MRRFILLTLTFLVGTLAKGQTDFSISQLANSDSSKAKLGIWFEQSFNSNAINNSVVFNLANKNGPTYESMQNLRNRVQPINRAGYNGYERIYYSQKLKNKRDSVNSTGFINVYTHRQLSTVFGEDPLRLIAFGNKEFAGKNADLDQLDLTLLQYTTIQFGYAVEKNGYTLGVAPGLVIGNKYGSIQSDGGYLYTSPIGDSLFVDVAGQWTQSDTASKLIYDPNGVGASADFFFSMPFDLFKKNKNTGNITFEVNDLGFIVWNKNTLSYNIDGEYGWGGFKAPSLFDLNDSLIDLQRPNDVQESLLDNTEKGTKNTFMPMRISVRYQEQLSEKVLLVATLEHRFMSQTFPFLGLNQEIRMNDISKKTGLNLRFYQSIGGYDYLGLGTGISVSNPKFDVIAGTRNLIGLMNTEYYSGFNVHFGFQWKFY
ncbi:DUF5723 family protein [Salibacteraceae bacterium]|nr:DUF5723 family protein [Salibacteraceae bacterium]MDB0058474.1 DUF5723 family protein [Salibacteraceae bacterium]MDC1204400.1 DUF5723 family protein [Salibacteraceae bacterium]